jgi:hypothetical protein
MSEPDDDLFESRDKLIAELRQQVADFESLPKEWEGSGYNPQQMARLVVEYRKLQKRAEQAERERDSLKEAVDKSLGVDLGLAFQRLANERDGVRAKCAEMLLVFLDISEYWNGNRNDRAMWDALNHILDEVQKVVGQPNPGQSLLDERDVLRERVKVLEILRAISEESLPLFQHLANKLITGDMAQVEADRLLMELDDALSAAKPSAEASARRPEALADGPEGKQEVKS